MPVYPVMHEQISTLGTTLAHITLPAAPLRTARETEAQPTLPAEKQTFHDVMT